MISTSALHGLAQNYYIWAITHNRKTELYNQKLLTNLKFQHLTELHVKSGTKTAIYALCHSTKYSLLNSFIDDYSCSRVIRSPRAPTSVSIVVVVRRHLEEKMSWILSWRLEKTTCSKSEFVKSFAMTALRPSETFSLPFTL